MRFFVFVSVRMIGAGAFALFVYLLLSKIEDLKSVKSFLFLFPAWGRRLPVWGRKWAGFIWLGITAKFAIFCGYLYFVWLAGAENFHAFYGSLGSYAFGALVTALAARMRSKNAGEAKF